MNEAIFRHSVHKETVQEEMVNQENLPFIFFLESRTIPNSSPNFEGEY